MRQQAASNVKIHVVQMARILFQFRCRKTVVNIVRNSVGVPLYSSHILSSHFTYPLSNYCTEYGQYLLYLYRYLAYACICSTKNQIFTKYVLYSMIILLLHPANVQSLKVLPVQVSFNAINRSH